MIITSLLGITELIGRFHPLIVHLPIGILLIASLFYFLSVKEKYTTLKTAVTIALFCGMLSAVVSCISGFILSNSDDYDTSMIAKHQWFGIATAVVSIIAYYLAKKNSRHLKWSMLLMVLLIFITGHLGGSLTHGSDYLTAPLSKNNNNTIGKREPIPDVQNALAYNEVIKPIFETKCYGCHGPNKQKGKLRLDDPGFILKGGEDGKVIIPGKPGESDLIDRILLSREDNDHMPPKHKPQLSKQDIDLLHWWVSSGADFSKKVNELLQTDKIKPILMSLQSGETATEPNAGLPEKPVEKADDKIIQQLKYRSVSVVPVAAGSNYLSVNFIATDTVRLTDLKLLHSIKKQLLWLKLGNKKIAPTLFAELSGLTTLTKIYLERTGIDDEGLKKLKALPNLQYINLTGNPVTEKGIGYLSSLKSLSHLYIYQTLIGSTGYVELKKLFPKALIDTGGYKVPVLPGDTTELKEAVKRN